jgi:hypothetical protein
MCIAMCFCNALSKRDNHMSLDRFFFPGRWVGDLPQEVLAKLGNRAERTISIN